MLRRIAKMGNEKKVKWLTTMAKALSARERA